MDGEAAGGGEAIERFAVGPAGGGDVVFPLVEIDAGFLAAGEIGVEDEVVHVHVDVGGRRAGEGAGAEGELFLGADGGVVTLPDAAGGEELFEELDDERLGAVHALREGLEDEGVVVEIDDEAWEAIGFGEDEAAGGGILNGAAAVGDGGLEAGAEEGFVEGFDLGGKEAEGDLGGGGEVGGAEGETAGVENGDGVAGAGVVGTVDVGGVDPDVAGSEAIGGTFLNAEGRAVLHFLPV